MRHILKEFITKQKLLLHLLSFFGEKFPKVFVYHRFTSKNSPISHRVNAATFAWQLDIIKENFNVFTLGQCVDYFLQHDRWPENSVVLTIDDGYQDMYTWAWPELAKRNLPATFFVTTGFVDQIIWLWPDRLEYALRHTKCTECEIYTNRNTVKFIIETDRQRSDVWKIWSDYCVTLPEDQRKQFISEVEELLNVQLPLTPTSDYAAVTWDQLREMQAGGLEIGGHTVTHPILSKIHPKLLGTEIGLCRRTLQEKLLSDINSFCYPNSGPGDINDAVITAVSQAGFLGAVFGTNLAQWTRYQIPRMAISDDRIDFLWKLFGGEGLMCRIGTGR
jgi:peptidoglycan/xylan/chitin deacetylase (PgdA/CDA1 family)